MRELKILIDSEKRGAVPADKEYPKPEDVFEPLYNDAGIPLDEREAFDFIATLAKAANIDPKSVVFSGSQWLPNVRALVS